MKSCASVFTDTLINALPEHIVRHADSSIVLLHKAGSNQVTCRINCHILRYTQNVGQVANTRRTPHYSERFDKHSWDLAQKRQSLRRVLSESRRYKNIRPTTAATFTEAIDAGLEFVPSYRQSMHVLHDKQGPTAGPLADRKSGRFLDSNIPFSCAEFYEPCGILRWQRAKLYPLKLAVSCITSNGRSARSVSHPSANQQHDAVGAAAAG